MKTFISIFICLLLYGCATTFLIKDIRVGMTKEEVVSSCGKPETWNRQIINGKTYESLNYNAFQGNFDFVDGVLVGFSRVSASGSMKYFSANSTEDTKNFKNHSFEK